MAPAIDYFSLLPSSLITAILSLLPLKDTVKTSILARSWRYAWKSTSNIEIIQSNFSSVYKCLDFSYNWLRQYPEPTIDRFSLTLTTPPNMNIHPLLHDYVNFALTRKTKTLELDLPEPSFDLPETIYDYTLLEHLKLLNCNFTQNFDNISLLKTATLGRMTLTDDALDDFLTDCPLLESLSLINLVENLEFTIVSPKMKSLVVDRCFDLSHITVLAPELRRFKYVGMLIEFLFLDDLTMLEEADLDFTYSEDHFEDSGDLVQGLLLRLKHASVLTVCTFIIQVLATAAHTWKLPQNIEVKHLILNTSLNQYEFIGILNFLRSSPWLTKIQLEIRPSLLFDDHEDNPTDDLDMETFWGDDLVEELGLPDSMRGCLSEVEINGYTGGDNELKFMHFLLDFGLVLTSFRVRVARDDKGVWRDLVKDIRRVLRTWRDTSGSCYEIDIIVE